MRRAVSLWIVIVATLLSTGSADSCPIVTFSCPPLPPITEPAKDVYSLRPQDIKVVMTLGDSVTAGAFIGAPPLIALYYVRMCVPIYLYIYMYVGCRFWHDGEPRQSDRRSSGVQSAHLHPRQWSDFHNFSYR